MKNDTISRQAAIDELERGKDKKAKGTVGGFYNQIIDNDIEKLRRLPSAQRWIPCSERLPDNNRQVLVYARSVHFALAKYDEMREADGSYKMQWVTFDAWKPFYKIKEVIAWMPLPEPWKGEHHD